MIPSVLDLDLYKLTMGQAVNTLYPNEIVRYEFVNRGKTKFPRNFDEIVYDECLGLKDLKITEQEGLFLIEKCPFLNPVYIDFLKGYEFNPVGELEIKQTDDNLKITVEGPWYRTIYWETILMSIISEEYFAINHGGKPLNEAMKINKEKADKLRIMGTYFADFGTRRRFSHQLQKDIVFNMIENAGKYFVGTSNVYLAMITNTVPKGTMAHEFIQFHAAKYGYRMANEMAMKAWTSVYQGQLGIALPDTFTSDVFLRAFNPFYAKLFDGVRQDSGDPFEFTDKIIDHYRKLKTPSETKSIIYSDGLNIDMVEKIQNYRPGEINKSYGIGTNLTNDIPGIKPLNIVIKMTGVKDGDDWIPAVKLSDDPGKHTGDPEEIKLCKKILKIN